MSVLIYSTGLQFLQASDDSYEHRYTSTVQTFNLFLHQSTGRLPVPVFVKHQWLTCNKNKPSAFSCEPIHAFTPENWVVIGRAVVYYAQPAHIFSAEIKCRHCMCAIDLPGVFSLTCYPWTYVQPVADRRPVDWCRN